MRESTSHPRDFTPAHMAGATVLPFTRPACHVGERFTPLGHAAVKQHFAREVATEGYAVDWTAGEGGDGDAIHVSDADGEPVASFGIDGGRVHAVGPAEAGASLATGATLGEVLAALSGRAKRHGGRA